MWESESESIGGQDHGNGRRRRRLSSTKNTDGFELRDKSWHVVTDVPSDFLVQVGDISFHLHKYPLLSRSGKINKIIQEDLNNAVFDDLPGGATAFETAAKFCYGVPVDLTPTNISGLRCAAEYLEMTEHLEQGNLVFKTEAFLSYVVLSSWNDSILVLKSCTSLSPWAEDLRIVRRCTESIAWKVCASPKQAPPDWWFEDVSVLEIDHFVKVVTAINAKSTRIRVMGAAIMHYAAKWLTIEVEDEDQRVIVESLISITPPQKDSVSCSFLLGLLRAARRLEVARGLIGALEKRVGVQLEQATLADLLIPCYDTSETSSCSYDVDLVGRLLEHFLARETKESTSGANRVSPDARARVARLIDGYLTEVSGDGDLSLGKFQVLAEALPESARTCDDGLYRAIDSYLKAHPTLSEHERKRLCRVMDCQKLSVDACLHAAQNERLPLRVVMQVLFSRQVKISSAIANNSEKGAGQSRYRPMVSSRKTLLEGTPQSFQEGWAAAKRDINTIEFEIETVKSMHCDLENEMESLQRRFEKMSKEKRAWAWSSGWKKLSYKFTKTTHMESQDVGGDQKRKTPKSRRNSVS